MRHNLDDLILICRSSSSENFQIYLILVPSRPKNESGRGPWRSDRPQPLRPSCLCLRSFCSTLCYIGNRVCTVHFWPIDLKKIFIKKICGITDYQILMSEIKITVKISLVNFYIRHFSLNYIILYIISI